MWESSLWLTGRHTSHEASCFGGCHSTTVSFLHGHLQPAIIVFYLLNWHPPVFSAKKKNMTHWYIGLCKNNPGKCIFYWVHLSYKVHLSSHLYMAVPWTVMQCHEFVHRAYRAWQCPVVTSCHYCVCIDMLAHQVTYIALMCHDVSCNVM